ncbi:Atxe2 family lasso peptide isopeptidase [Sphingobium fuliginis]|uniref:Acylaminoacyl-peptidase n=1 Tax=Sphingobium fuliginis (strain ATCC 27551) TaxID=336203 RepID=A0A292ZB52_SPHSA|nr:Atxe2 family lasso peptide isopeptidase [Sphingobium fuliginis]GAY20121.1 acylaminoacyl-peptidase [Sphingobium fuliginis]
MVTLVGVATVAPTGDAPTTLCADIDWSKAKPPPIIRTLAPEDLVRLRDVGPAGDAISGERAFSLSPDRRFVTFQVRQADAEANDYCIARVVLPLFGDRKPVIVNAGGELRRKPAGGDSLPQRMTGLPVADAPIWSPDGSWIAFLRQDGGRIRLWRAAIDGSGSAPIAAVDSDIRDFRFANAATIVLKLDGDEQKARANIEREAQVGFHFDSRFAPVSSSGPYAPISAPDRLVTLDIRSGSLRPANLHEARLFLPARDAATQLTGEQVEGDCRIGRDYPGNGVPPIPRLTVHCPGRTARTCDHPACSAGVGAAWLVHGSATVRFVRQEGWAQSETAIYEWDSGRDIVIKRYATTALLIDCQPRDTRQLICLRETSLKPRHLAAIDLDRGRAHIIADFNPEFSRLRMGRAERIPLKSSAGIEAFGDLVYPADYRAGQRYPLIVVQYESRGFLRGGTGDEFPIQAFASNGFAVLSIQRPAPVGALSRPKDYVEVDRINLQGFADRQNVLSVVEQGVRLLIDRGIADPKAIGITGLSDGSSTVQFAAINSSLFSAAIVSGCCWDTSQTALLGPAVASRYARIGWPDISEDASSFWSRMSLSRNARRVAFPILFSMADEEFRMALEAFTALREVGKPADLYVFPDEHHIKWQPAHRLAAYQRGIDWFRYWLRGELPVAGRRREEAQHWQAMNR